MHRRTRALLTVALVVLAAGCTGPAHGPAEDPPSTATPTHSPTPTVSPEPRTTAASGPTAANTVRYATLSAGAKAAFDAALAGEAKFFPDSPHVEGDYRDPAVFDEFRDDEYVAKNGTTYALSRHHGELYASYTVYAEAESPGENATAVPHGNLSANVSAQVRSAIENGSHEVPLGEWDSLHPDLDGVEYVRYEGRTYRLSYAVGDHWVQVLTAEPAQ